MAEIAARLHADETPFMSEGPQPLLREIAPGEAYPVHALGPLNAAVVAVQGMTQAPVAIPAQSALSVASLAVQGFANVETLGGDRPLSLYAMTIAVSGERKSTCDGLLMQGLRDFEREEADRHRDDVKSWMTRHALWKAQHDAAINSVKKTGKGSKTQAEAEADLRALGDEPAAPPGTERTLPAPTVQGLTRHYRENQPSAGLFSDEGGKFLGGYAMSSENRLATLAAMNDLWGGAPVRVGLGGEGVYTLYGRRLAVHLMVQPGVARDFMADPKADDTGFLPRFLLCEPPSTIGTRLHDRAVDGSKPLASFAARLSGILRTPLPMMDPDSRELEPRRLQLAADARALIIRFSDTVEIQQRDGGDLSGLTGYASKAAEQACRIAGVMAMWRDLHASEVTSEDMANGIALAQFYLSEALRLADAAKVSEETDRAERLRRWLSETWPHAEITTSEVVRHGPVRALRETKVAASTLAILEKHGWVAALPAGTVIRGAPRSTGWRIFKGGDHVV